MSQYLTTKGIVLSRTNFQEADRILTVITPDHGKLRVIAKGARRPKSKLAGGIELYSVNELTIISNKSEIKTLVSSRLSKHYDQIVTDINRTMLGYEIIKCIHRNTEDAAETEYFSLTRQVFEGLNDLGLSTDKLELWSKLQLLKLAGHSLNLKTDLEGARLIEQLVYLFDNDRMAFYHHKEGYYDANHIKLLRLASSVSSPLALNSILNDELYTAENLRLISNIFKIHLRV